MNDERNENNNADGDELVDVTLQWYKANVVRLIFNGRIIWETKDIALDDIVRDAAESGDAESGDAESGDAESGDAESDNSGSGDAVANGNANKIFRETTLRLDMQESINYSRILLQGLQIGRLERMNTLVQLRVQQWELKVALFEMQLKQRMIDLGFTSLLKAINPDDPDSYRDGDDKYDDGDGGCCSGQKCSDDRSGEPCAYDNDTCDMCLDSGSVPSCGGKCEDCDGEYCESLGIDDIEGDDDTLWLCKGCDGTRNSCAGCEDADPNDRHMSEADGESDYNAEPDYNAERANESEKSGGTGEKPSAGDVGGIAGGAGQICDDDDIYRRDCG